MTVMTNPCPVPNCGGIMTAGHEVCPSCESVAEGFKHSVGKYAMSFVADIKDLRELFFLGRNFLCVRGGFKPLEKSVIMPVFEGKKELVSDVHFLQSVLWYAGTTKVGEYPILDKALAGYTKPRNELPYDGYAFQFKKSIRPVQQDGIIHFDSVEADVADKATKSRMMMIKNALNKAFVIKALQKGQDMARLWNESLESGFAGWIKGEFRRHARSRIGNIEYSYLPQIEALEKIEEPIDRLKRHFS